MSEDRKKYRLIIDVEFIRNGTPEKFLSSNMCYIASHADQVGMFTFDCDAKVAGWNYTVEEIND